MKTVYVKFGVKLIDYNIIFSYVKPNFRTFVHRKKRSERATRREACQCVCVAYFDEACQIKPIRLEYYVYTSSITILDSDKSTLNDFLFVVFSAF